MVIQLSKGNEEKKYGKSKIMINPNSVQYFYPISMNINGEDKNLVVVAVGAEAFWIDMPFEKFNEFWNNVKRSFELDEPLY